MTPQPDQHDIARELQATMEARRELGAQYDEQFIQSLVERLTAQVRREVESARPVHQRLDTSQRTGIAISSLVFLIPLVAIMGGMAGPAGMVLACLVVLGVNVVASL
jgi:phytoene/squalene synthetase